MAAGRGKLGIGTVEAMKRIVGMTCLAAIVVALVGLTVSSPVSGAAAATVAPKLAHVVVVIEENHSLAEVQGISSSAPYINSPMKTGANFTNSVGVAHPSQPNYLTLFSGSVQGQTSDSCPHTFGATNLGAQLRAAGKSFTSYAESLPYAGDPVCASGAYARKHVPSTDFSDLPVSVNHTFATFSKSNFAALPAVSFVAPNLNDDMHNGSIAAGDTWLKSNLSAYVTWAKANNSVLVVVWDEDDHSQSNKIPMFIVGAHVKTGNYSETTNHYRLLRTIEAIFSLPGIGSAKNYPPITDAWN